ncbi:MAG: CocE/NonD family hydrolase [Chloroflexi bacterium]|nr:CocE/NonD family hydrolase [Chloroflexota bacterium]
MINLHNVHLESDADITMRDGVRLVMDVYSPADDSGNRIDKPWPVILVRTSYNKTFSEWDDVPQWYAQRGYVFVLQDLRSRYKSEGDGRYYHTCNPWEGDDGFDTIEWIAEQPWSNGKVGMIGSSHRAIVQTQAALHSPPHLAAICPEQGPTNIYLHEAREGGAMAMHMYTAIYNHGLDAQEVRGNNAAISQLARGLSESRKWLQNMPFKPGEIPLAAAPHLEETLFNYYYRGEYDEWWAQECNDQTPYWDRHADIPCLITGGWYDPFVDACTGYFEAMKERIDSTVRLIIGPWSHGTMRQSTTSLGEVDFGKAAMLGYPAHHELRKRWFDQWLLDEDAGVDSDAPVEIFIMGGGTGLKTADGLLDHGGAWRSEQEWPIARTQLRTAYMSVDGDLIDERSDAVASISYEHDPENPVPTAGGSMAHLAEIGEPAGGWDDIPEVGQGAAVYGGQGRQIVPWGPMDQREHDWFDGDHAAGRKISERPDVLVFETEPLTEDTEVTGQVIVNLFISSSAIDTDFTAKLIDVYRPNEDYPDGYEMNLIDTVLRTRYRNSWTEPEMMTPGEVYPITITLPTTSNLFQTGHRIRIDISSSNFPRLEINPNTGEPVGRHTHAVVATNTVHIGGDAASHVVLPIIPAS